MKNNIVALQKRIYENNVAKGFWENANQKEKLALIASEMVEALEEVRAKRPAMWISDDSGSPITIEVADKNSFVLHNGNDVTHLKPEGECFEIVDAIVRSLDMMTHFKWFYEPQAKLIPLDVTEKSSFYYDLMAKVFDPRQGAKEKLQNVIATCERYSLSQGWDLWEAVEIKVSYNETRKFKHGKAF